MIKEFFQKKPYQKYLFVLYLIYLSLLIIGLFHYNETFTSTPSISGSPLKADQNFYDRTGFNISNGKGYSINNKPTSHYQIGYPLFLGVIYFIFGHSYKIVIIIQIIMLFFAFVLLSILSMKINRSLFFLPLLLFIFNYTIHQHAYKLLTEVLTIFLLSLSIYLLYKFSQSDKNHLLILIGIIYGYLTLVRPTFFVFPFLLVGFSVYYLARSDYKTFLKYIIFFSSFSLVIFPVMFRNYKNFGIFNIRSSGGLGFYMGTDPDSDGLGMEWNKVESDFNLKKFYGNKSQDISISASTDKIAFIDRVLFKEALKNIKKHPFRVASVVGKNASRLLFYFPYKNHKLSLQRSILALINIIFTLSFVIGLYFIIRKKYFGRKERMFLLFCSALILYFVMVSSLFIVTPRYGIHPLILIYLLSPVYFPFIKITDIKRKINIPN